MLFEELRIYDGVEASAVPASDLDVGPDFRRALSLLSTDSWVHPVNPMRSNLSQLANTTSHNNSAVQAANTTMMGYWQEPNLLAHQAWAFPFELRNNNGGQYLEFPPSKFPYKASFFDSGQILSKLDSHFLESKT